MEDKKVNSFELKKTVLIVDDEEINRDILAMQLSNDFNILEADDGKAAIDLLLDPEHKIDLVVIDVNMPYSGQQVLKDRQENPKLRSIPFFVCTSEKETTVKNSCFYVQPLRTADSALPVCCHVHRKNRGFRSSEYSCRQPEKQFTDQSADCYR